MKTCARCGEEKPLEDFHRDKGSSDGHRPRCKVCVKEYDDTLREDRNRRAREAYALDPASKIEQTRQYHLEHPEWSKERLRASHEKHRVVRQERQNARLQDPVKREASRDASRRSEQRRRAQKRGLEADFITKAQFEERLLECGTRCHICEYELGPDLHWDHLQPLAAGGAHTLANLFPSCNLCNIRKNACWPFTQQMRERIRKEVLALREQARMGLGGDRNFH